MSDEKKYTVDESPVSIRMHEGYSVNLKVNVVGADVGQIGPVLRLRCRPRQGAPRHEKEALELPAPVRDAFGSINDTLLQWLARDTTHLKQFLADPMEALQTAGVKIERSTLKAITRLQQEVAAASSVHPGLHVERMTATVTPKGRITTDAGADGDCSCHDEKEA